MKTSFLKIFFGALLVTFLFVSANAQKDSAKKITLAPKGAPTVVKGTLPAKGDVTDSYSFRGVKGQRVKITIDFTGKGEADFSFKLPNGANVDEENIINTDWAGKLPQTGDYKINVFNPSKIRGLTKYTLTITLE